MAVWTRSTRRGSCSSNGSNNYKPNSPAQASPAPRNIASPTINVRNECCRHERVDGGVVRLNPDGIRKRGRPRKNLSLDNNHYFIDNQKKYAHKIQCRLATCTEQTQLSEYELLNMRRREEVLSMFRELFSVDSMKTEEKKEKRKYSRRPLPPLRQRSLRILGLAPGQRLLRKRRHSAGPRCLCCWLPKSNKFALDE